MGEFSDLIPRDLNAEIAFVKNYKFIRKLFNEINKDIFLNRGEIYLNSVGHISSGENPEDFPLPNIHLMYKRVVFSSHIYYYGVRVYYVEKANKFKIAYYAIQWIYGGRGRKDKKSIYINVDELVNELVDVLKLA